MKLRNLYTIFLVFLTANTAAAFDTSEQGLYAQMLRTYTHAVDDLAGTRVDYAGLAGDPRWRQTVQSLEATPASERKTREQQLAFWINAYNIFAIDMVVQNLPLKSIRNIGNLFWPVWKRPAGSVDGTPVTLDGIENQTLRPMGDPRIHAAIVCTSLSCPSLRRTPYTPDAIEGELDARARNWLANSNKGMAIERKQGQLRISKIFDWFEEDFGAVGGVRAFLARYAPPGDQGWLQKQGPSARIRYFDYDWALNSVATAPGSQ